MRIIPTHVGTSSTLMVRSVSVKDHPHACGDKFENKPDYFAVKGSSPRVWGQDNFTALKKGGIWIIPTRVGTRLKSSSVNSHVRDHPHACGDKQRQSRMRLWTIGSSPRVWGQVEGGAVCKLRVRIIPTRMGTSTPRPCKCGG